MAWMRGALWPLGLMIPKWYHHRIVGCVLLKLPDRCTAGYVEDLCPKTEFSQVSRYLGISVPGSSWSNSRHSVSVFNNDIWSYLKAVRPARSKLHEASWLEAYTPQLLQFDKAFPWNYIPWVVQSLSINNEGDCWSLHLEKDSHRGALQGLSFWAE